MLYTNSIGALNRSDDLSLPSVNKNELVDQRAQCAALGETLDERTIYQAFNRNPKPKPTILHRFNARSRTLHILLEEGLKGKHVK